MNVTEGSGLSGYAAFGRLASRDTVSYLRKRSDDFRGRITSERIGRFIDDFDNSSRRLNIGVLKDELRIAKRRERNIFDDGHIKYIHEVRDIQHSNPSMRRLIMADVEMRRLARTNQIEGWSTNYDDPDPAYDGWRHRDFRRLTTGLYILNEDKVYESNYYYEDQAADELTLTEKLDALRTIDRVKRLIKQRGEDPTSINGGQLT